MNPATTNGTSQPLPIRPGAGILATVAATVAAVAMTPAEVEARGALFWPGLMMSIGLAWVPLQTAWSNPKAILRGEHLLVLSPIFWLLWDLIQGSYDMPGITAHEVRLSFVSIGLFVVGVWAASIARPWRPPGMVVHSANYNIETNTFFALILLAFALGIFRFALPCNFNPVEMFYWLGRSRFEAPWSRGATSAGWDAIIDHMSYFGFLLPALTVVFATKTSWTNGRTLVALLLSLTMTALLAQGGGRRLVGVMFGMGIILWILLLREIRLRNVVIVIASVGMVLFIMQSMIEYRSVGYSAAFKDKSGDLVIDKSAMAEEEAEEEEIFHVDDNFYRMSQVIQLIPGTYPHVYGQHLLWVLVRPVPRVLWPGKPMGPGFDLSAVVGAEGASLSMSVVGEFYMSGGLIVVLLGGWLYGRLAGMASTLLTRTATPGALIIYSVSTMALFAGMRSMIELVLTSYVILAWVGICHLYGFLSGKRGLHAGAGEAGAVSWPKHSK